MKKFYMVGRFKDANGFDCYKTGCRSNDLLGLRAEIACRFYEGRLNKYSDVWIASKDEAFYMPTFECMEDGELLDKFFKRG